MVRLRHRLIVFPLQLQSALLSLTDARILFRLSNRSNALFVVLVETGLGWACDTDSKEHIVKDALNSLLKKPIDKNSDFYENNFGNDYKNPLFYQGIEARIKYS